jgi:hypothetical protein
MHREQGQREVSRPDKGKLVTSSWKRRDNSVIFFLEVPGSYARHQQVYASVRGQLSPPSQGFWDKRIGFFGPTNLKKSFHYRGTSGLAAWVMGTALFKLRPNISMH